ncbi:MAG: serine/threonine protein kinase [Myxococcota bacterium]|jgi:serine/threonine protein kinase
MVHSGTERDVCLADGVTQVWALSGMGIDDRYEIRELIGTGSEGSTVWSGFDALTATAVAIKILPAGSQEVADRFLRGAEIAASLDHPHIASVSAFGRFDDGAVYLIMELLKGSTLEETLGREAMALAPALDALDQLLGALGHAHQTGAIHRDLKPENLFMTVDQDGKAALQILDFGIAKYDAEHTDARGPSAQVSGETDICGTPFYMAPEQIIGEAVGARSDIYSTGVVMYRLLTGRLPFRARNSIDIFHRHLHTPPPPLADVMQGAPISAAVEAVVMRALAKAPEDRFQDAAAMRAALRDARSKAVALPDEAPLDAGPAPTERPVQSATQPHKARRGLWLVAALILLAGTAIAVWQLADAPEEPASKPGSHRKDLRIHGIGEVGANTSGDGVAANVTRIK